jgi:hypothetical protein
MTYRDAVWAGYHERSVGARIGTLAGVVTLPLLSLVSWLLSLPTELQTVLWAAFAMVAWLVGLDIGRAAWKKTRAELDQVQRDLVAERHYKAALGVELKAPGATPVQAHHRVVGGVAGGQSPRGRREARGG